MSFPISQAQAQSQQRQVPLLPRQTRPALPPMMPPTRDFDNDAAQHRKRKRDRACDLCRRKKIRCDYDHIQPDNACSSCRSYDKMCTFVEAARKRGPPKGYVEGLEDRLRRMEALLMNAAAGKTGQLSPEQVRELGKPAHASDDGDDAPASPSLPKAQANENEPHLETTTAETREKKSSVDQRWELLVQAHKDARSSSHRGDAKYSYMGSSSGIHLLSKLFLEDEPSMKSNGWLNKAPSSEEDMMVPRLKDDSMSTKLSCGLKNPAQWKTPPQEVVDRLVELYFMKMNIYLPIVDKADFYESYQKGGDAVCIPLVLTLCRSACRLLDEDDWVVKKYNINRNQLFVEITEELESKFVADFLNPKIENIQVFLVSALSTRRWTPESTDWLGVSLAVKMAQDLGLHRSDTRLGVPCKRREAQKRLWWSAYVLDRWICAALGRPLAISDADCDVELPNVDADDDRFAFLVHLTKLSAILGDILRVMCSPRARSLGNRRFGMDQVRQSLERNLWDWETALPDHLKLSAADLDRIKERDLSLELEVRLNTGVGQLHMAYQSLILLLKRPFISKSTETQTLQLPRECIESTEVVISIIEVMHVKSLLNLSWSLTSYIMTQALIITVYGLRNPDDAIVSFSRRTLERIRNQYRRLESYISEPSVIPLLDLFARLVESDKDESTPLVSGSTRDSQLPAIDLSETSSADISRPNTSTDQSTQSADEQQRPLWGAPSGFDWQELMTVLTERGYNF